MAGILRAYMFDFMCGTCYQYTTLQYEADREGRPPAPADVPFSIPCRRPECNGTMRRS